MARPDAVVQQGAFTSTPTAKVSVKSKLHTVVEEHAPAQPPLPALRLVESPSADNPPSQLSSHTVSDAPSMAEVKPTGAPPLLPSAKAASPSSSDRMSISSQTSSNPPTSVPSAAASPLTLSSEAPSLVHSAAAPPLIPPMSIPALEPLSTTKDAALADDSPADQMPSLDLIKKIIVGSGQLNRLQQTATGKFLALHCTCKLHT